MYMEEWMRDELVREIPAEKLAFLSKLLSSRMEGRTQKENLQMILPLIRDARAHGISFSAKEVSAAIAAIRKYSSPEENERIDEILRRAKYPTNGNS